MLLFHIELIVTVTMYRSCLLLFLLVLLSDLAGNFCIFVDYSWGRFFGCITLHWWRLYFPLLIVSTCHNWCLWRRNILKLIDLYFLCRASFKLNRKRSFKVWIFCKATTTGQFIKSCYFLYGLYFEHNWFLKIVHDGCLWNFLDSMYSFVFDVR